VICLSVADTSFLYALFSRSDVFHKKARAAVTSATEVLVPSEIYSETVSLIHHRAGFQAARAAGQWIRAQEGFRVRPPTPPVLDRAWGLFRRARGQLSYPDAIVLAWCRERRATPLAFDRAIVRRTRA
jgi:predicted nucleic acid-binding protein